MRREAALKRVDMEEETVVNSVVVEENGDDNSTPVVDPDPSFTKVLTSSIHLSIMPLLHNFYTHYTPCLLPLIN